MRKKLALLLGSSLIISNCTIPAIIKDSQQTTPINKLNTTDLKKVEIEVLNPSNEERASVEWYQDNTKTLIMKINAKAKVIGTVTLKDQTKSSNIKWSSSDTTIATVNDSGIIQASKIGNTTILATSFVDSAYKQVLNVKVVDEANFTPEKLAEVKKVETKITKYDKKQTEKVDNNNINVLAGAKIKATGRVFLADGTETSNVIWSSSDQTIATVDETGNITIKDTAEVGTAGTIIAKYRLNPEAKQVIHIEVVDTISDNNNSPEIENTPVSLATPTVTSIPTAISDSISATPTPLYTPIATSTPVATPNSTPTATLTATPTATPTPVQTPTHVLVGNETKSKIGEGSLNKPGGIAFNNGKIYISDAGKFGLTCAYATRGEIKVFNAADGVEQTSIYRSCGSNMSENLTGIATDGNKIWVASRLLYSQAKINMYGFNIDGTLPTSSTLGLSTATIKDLALDAAQSTIYAVDGANIIKTTYDSSGTLSANPQLLFLTNVNASGITLDDLGNILAVTNSTPPTIIKYGKNGTEMLRFTTAGKNNGAPAGISAVGDVAYDPRNGGTIYVVAQLSSNSKIVILRFDSQGNFIRYFGEDANMSNPTGMAVGTDGTLYVLDQGANLIHQFGPAK